MRIDIVDVSLALDQSGEPRVNLGDVTSGVGFASGVPTFGNGDGFVGIPNGPDGSNQAPQALMLTQGNLRLALAVRDPRFEGKAGTLAEGDRAIVSNCDAGLLLDKSANTIALLATAQNMSTTLDASAKTITSSVETTQVQVGQNTASMSINGLGSDGTSVSITPTNITLQLGPLILTMTGTTVSIVTQEGPPATLLVNLIPVTVP